MSDPLENYVAIKKGYFEFIEFGADIKYYKNNEESLQSGGYIIGNYESNENGRYFIVRSRTNVKTQYILYYDNIKKLYRKKTIYDILINSIGSGTTK